MLRLESLVQRLIRATAKDVELSGVMIPAGSQINARLAAETCDEQRFENPHTLDLDLVVDRLWAWSHVAFWLWQKPLFRRFTCPRGAALVVQGTRRSRH